MILDLTLWLGINPLLPSPSSKFEIGQDRVLAVNTGQFHISGTKAGLLMKLAYIVANLSKKVHLLISAFSV